MANSLGRTNLTDSQKPNRFLAISACLPSYFLVTGTDGEAPTHSARTYRALGRVRFWWSGSPWLLCFARKNTLIFEVILVADRELRSHERVFVHLE